MARRIPVADDQSECGGGQVEWVEVGGLRLRISVVGRLDAADHPPLLLCNGIGAALEAWGPLREALGGRPSIAFDAPGAGGSSVPVAPVLMGDIARTVVRLLDHLGVDRVDVLGVSWGGALAQTLAYRHPTRVRRVVLCSTAAGGLMVPGSPRVLAILASRLRHWSPTYLYRVATALYGADVTEDPIGSGHRRPIRVAPRPPSGRGYLYQILALLGFASALWLHRLSQPTLVMTGDSDPITPAINGRILATLIPDARQVRVPGAGHLFPLTRATATARLVTEFLDTPAESG